MKFAFSTVACPQWDFEIIVARAKQYGYDGVEIRGFLNQTPLTAANVFAGEPGKLREMFAAGGVAVACLSSSIAMSGSARADEQLAADVRKYIETAAALNCPLLKVPGPQAQSGRSLTEVAGSFGRWLAPLVDVAAEKSVTLAVENSPPFRRAKEIWTALEVVNHPSLAAAWDVCGAALAGETPAVGIPVLNSRLAYVSAGDAIIDGTAAGICRLGEGGVHLRDMFNRLRGVGYNGWVCFEWPKAMLAGLSEPEAVLADAIAKMRDWATPKVVAKPAKPEPRKPAAGAEARKPAATAAAPAAAAAAAPAVPAAPAAPAAQPA